MKRFLKVLFSFIFLGVSGVLLSACGSNTLIPVAGVDFYEEEVYAVIGDTIDLKHKVYPSNASNSLVSYWSTDDNIVSISEDGVATVKDSGEAYVVVRTIDGGYIDRCKIVTKIDPDDLTWKTTDRRITPVTDKTKPYSGEATVAVDQDIKLEVVYWLNGIEDNSAITNKNIKFTSSNPDNIEVINESEGILRAVDTNIRSEEGTPYSDITASIQTSKGELKITCRVYVNEYSTSSKLILNKVNGNEPILVKRDGSDKLVLDADNSAGVECYTFLMNTSDYLKSDYKMSIYSSDTSVFEVMYLESNDQGKYYFTIVPKKEGDERLCIDTTCYDESGKQISVVVNISVQASVDFVKVTAKDNKKYQPVTNYDIKGYQQKWVKLDNSSGEPILNNLGIPSDSDFIPLVYDEGSEEYRAPNIEEVEALGYTVVYVEIDGTPTADVDYIYKTIEVLGAPTDVKYKLIEVPVYEAQESKFGTEIVESDEIFSLDMTYYDEVFDKNGEYVEDKIIEGAERKLYFEDMTGDLIVYKDSDGAYILMSVVGASEPQKIYIKTLNNLTIPAGGRKFSNCSSYISKYGNNSFKVVKVPQNIDEEFYILGYVAKNNSAEGTDGVEDMEDRVYFIYTFYIRSKLDGVICSVKDVSIYSNGITTTTTLPSVGTEEVTITLGREIDLYLFAYSFDLTAPQPAKVTIDYSALSGKLEVIQDSSNENKYTFRSKNNTTGAGIVKVSATNGEKTVSIEIIVHIEVDMAG